MKHRRRVHDVFIYPNDNLEYVVYDSVEDKQYIFETEIEAIQKFRKIKSQDKKAKLT